MELTTDYYGFEKGRKILIYCPDQEYVGIGELCGYERDIPYFREELIVIEKPYQLKRSKCVYDIFSHESV
jgi:hypothetical protein